MKHVIIAIYTFAWLMILFFEILLSLVQLREGGGEILKFAFPVCFIAAIASAIILVYGQYHSWKLKYYFVLVASTMTMVALIGIICNVINNRG